MARGKHKLQIKAAVNVSVGWATEIGDIVAILCKGRRDGSRAARPIITMIQNAAANDRHFMQMVAKQDIQAAANRLYKIARALIRDGVKPINKPWAIVRKKGDRRALRHVAGADRIYEDLITDPPAK